MAEAPKDEAPKDHVTLVVRDTDGLEVRRWRERVQLGMNRIVWRFERNGVAGPSRELQEDPELPPGGPEVLPGDYTLTVQFQGAEQTVPLRVLADPRVDIPRVERLARRQFQDDRDALMGMLRGATQGLARARKELEWVESRLKLDPKPKTGDDPLAALRKATEEARKALDELDVRMWGPKDRKGITDDEGLMHDVWEQLGHVTRSLRAPNPTEELALRRARTRAGAVTGAAEGFLSGPFTTWRTAVEQAQALLLPSAGKPCVYMGEGGTIPFMGMLGEKFPEAQFLITGVLGPNSNAHGPNEFLHIPMGKRLTGCVAMVLQEHLNRKEAAAGKSPRAKAGRKPAAKPARKKGATRRKA